MNYDTFLEAYKTMKRDSVVKISTVTDVGLKGGKKNPQQGRIKKLITDMTITPYGEGVVTNVRYADLVQAQMIAEGKDPSDYKPGKRAWGTDVSGLPLIEHKGNYYLKFMPEDGGTDRKYLLEDLNIEGHYIEITPAEMIGFETPTKKDTTDRQDRPTSEVIARTVKLESIFSMSVDGVEFR